MDILGSSGAKTEMMIAKSRKDIRIRTTVQGVGFRPFVLNLAKCLELSGFVRNTEAGVEIEVEGQRDPGIRKANPQ